MVQNSKSIFKEAGFVTSTLNKELRMIKRIDKLSRIHINARRIAISVNNYVVNQQEEFVGMKTEQNKKKSYGYSASA